MDKDYTEDEAKIRKINLRKKDLFGWEGEKEAPIVDALVQKLVYENLKTPPVYAYQINPNTYQLTELAKANDEGIKLMTKDGGHTRARAHFKAKKNLELLIIGERDEVYFGNKRPINIRDIKEINDEEAQRRYRNLIEKHPNYAPNMKLKMEKQPLYKKLLKKFNIA